MKGVQEKESIVGVRGRQKQPIPRDHSLASLLVMPDSDSRDGFFYPPLKQMIDPFTQLTIREVIKHFFYYYLTYYIQLNETVLSILTPGDTSTKSRNVDVTSRPIVFTIPS